jgi:hypothetical protein
VVKKWHAGADAGAAGAVQVQSQIDLGFLGMPFEFDPPRNHAAIKRRNGAETKRKSSPI